eukprot:tig00020934_g16080.t1
MSRHTRPTLARVSDFSAIAAVAASQEMPQHQKYARQIQPKEEPVLLKVNEGNVYTFATHCYSRHRDDVRRRRAACPPESQAPDGSELFHIDTTPSPVPGDSNSKPAAAATGNGTDSSDADSSGSDSASSSSPSVASDGSSISDSPASEATQAKQGKNAFLLRVTDEQIKFFNTQKGKDAEQAKAAGRKYRTLVNVAISDVNNALLETQIDNNELITIVRGYSDETRGQVAATLARLRHLTGPGLPESIQLMPGQLRKQLRIHLDVIIASGHVDGNKANYQRLIKMLMLFLEDSITGFADEPADAPSEADESVPAERYAQRTFLAAVAQATTTLSNNRRTRSQVGQDTQLKSASQFAAQIEKAAIESHEDVAKSVSAFLEATSSKNYMALSEHSPVDTAGRKGERIEQHILVLYHRKDNTPILLLEYWDGPIQRVLAGNPVTKALVDLYDSKVEALFTRGAPIKDFNSLHMAMFDVDEPGYPGSIDHGMCYCPAKRIVRFVVGDSSEGKKTANPPGTPVVMCRKSIHGKACFDKKPGGGQQPRPERGGAKRRQQSQSQDDDDTVFQKDTKTMDAMGSNATQGIRNHIWHLCALRTGARLMMREHKQRASRAEVDRGLDELLENDELLELAPASSSTPAPALAASTATAPAPRAPEAPLRHSATSVDDGDCKEAELERLRKKLNKRLAEREAGNDADSDIERLQKRIRKLSKMETAPCEGVTAFQAWRSRKPAERNEPLRRHALLWHNHAMEQLDPHPRLLRFLRSLSPSIDRALADDEQALELVWSCTPSAHCTLSNRAGTVRDYDWDLHERHRPAAEAGKCPYCYPHIARIGDQFLTFGQPFLKTPAPHYVFFGPQDFDPPEAQLLLRLGLTARPPQPFNPADAAKSIMSDLPELVRRLQRDGFRDLQPSDDDYAELQRELLERARQIERQTANTRASHDSLHRLREASLAINLESASFREWLAFTHERFVLSCIDKSQRSTFRLCKWAYMEALRVRLLEINSADFQPCVDAAGRPLPLAAVEGSVRELLADFYDTQYAKEAEGSLPHFAGIIKQHKMTPQSPPPPLSLRGLTCSPVGSQLAGRLQSHGLAIMQLLESTLKERAEELELRYFKETGLRFRLWHDVPNAETFLLNLPPEHGVRVSCVTQGDIENCFDNLPHTVPDDSKFPDIVEAVVRLFDRCLDFTQARLFVSPDDSFGGRAQAYFGSHAQHGSHEVYKRDDVQQLLRSILDSAVVQLGDRCAKLKRGIPMGFRVSSIWQSLYIHYCISARIEHLLEMKDFTAAAKFTWLFLRADDLIVFNFPDFWTELPSFLPVDPPILRLKPGDVLEGGRAATFMDVLVRILASGGLEHEPLDKLAKYPHVPWLEYESFYTNLPPGYLYGVPRSRAFALAISSSSAPIFAAALRAFLLKLARRGLLYEPTKQNVMRGVRKIRPDYSATAAAVLRDIRTEYGRLCSRAHDELKPHTPGSMRQVRF